jgi:hypothetical protein
MGIWINEAQYNNTPFYIPEYNSYQGEPQLPPSTHIHPDSPAAILGITPEELAPILRDQQEFLRNELAQPPPIITRPTTYCLIPATEQLGLTQEEIEEVLEDQREWMREEEEQRQEVGEQHTAGAHHQHHSRDQGIARPQSAPPPVVHPESAAAQLGLTLEEAEEIHKECLHAQEEIQEEMEAEDRITSKQKAGRSAHKAYDMTNDHDAYTASSERSGGYSGEAN